LRFSEDDVTPTGADAPVGLLLLDVTALQDRRFEVIPLLPQIGRCSSERR
jgi:hypothetical protein